MKKRLISISLILMMVISLLPRVTISVWAATAPTNIWIAPSETNGIPAQIDIFKSGTSYQLYLPGNVDLSKCYLSWDGDSAVTVDGASYTSGTCPIPAADVTKTYTFKSGSSTLASVSIITYQGSANVHQVFIDIDESLGTIAAMDGDSNHDATCSGLIYIDGVQYTLESIKGRGNASWSSSKDKKPYNVKIGTKITFGLDTPVTKKWSFLAECLDHSLLCNRSGFYMAEQLGIGQPTTSADVWMNGEYQGCYTITPKTDSYVSKNGFMIEQDNYLEDAVSEGGDPQFKLDGLNEASGWSSCYNRITVKKMGDNLLKVDGVVDESAANLEAVALNTIKPWLQDAWDAIRSTDGYNSKGKYYTDYIDIKSFAKMYLMQEYVKNYDVCAGSLLYYREGMTDNDKLFAGPIWDLDNSLGATCNNSNLGSQSDRRSAQGSFIANITEYKTSVYKTLSKHSDFMEEVMRIYNQYKSVFENASTDCQSLIDEIAVSARMNHLKVTDLGNGTYSNLHYYRRETTLGTAPYSQTYKATTNAKSDWANYAANLKTYMTTRSLWFHDNYYDENYVCQHEYEAVVTEPTCTAEGYTTYTCKFCGESYVADNTPKIPHDYQDGVCTHCGETLLTAVIECPEGASVTVYETKDTTGAGIEHAEEAHPRDGDTGLIDCSGEAQINFAVIPVTGHEIVSVTAEPAEAYKNFKVIDEENHIYRLTKVIGDLTITVVTEGHDWSDPEYTWSEDLSTATASRYCKNDPSVVEEETVTTKSEVTKAPTCEEAGTRTYTAVFENEVFETQTATAEIPATGHSYGTPSYTWSSDKSSVTASVICQTDETHVVTETVNTTSAVTIEPGCETDGVRTYTAVFTKEQFTTQTATEVIPETGHDYELTDWTWAEDFASATATFTCKNDETHVQTADAVITSVTTAATCEAEGKIVYTATATFEGEEYMDDQEKTLEAIGHDYELTGWTWAEDFASATATFTCKNDETHVETADAVITSVTTAATCEAEGKIVYTATAAFEGKDHTDTKEQTIPKLGHNYGTPTYVWAEDLSSVTATSVCEHDASHIETETVNTTSEVTTAPACKTEGVKTYTAAFENLLFSTQTETEIIPATGHDYELTGWTWAEDFTSATATFTCKNDDTHAETVDAVITSEMTAATCKTEGKIDYKATVVFEEKEYTDAEKVILPELGHKYGTPEYVWAEDLSSVTATSVCEHDASHIETETVNTTSEVTTPAECESDGVRTYTAVFEKNLFTTQTKTEVIPETGHDYELTGWTWAEDFSTAKVTFTCKNDPEHVEVVDAVITSVTTEPTCEEAGKTVYTAKATFEDNEYTDSKEQAIPALGHKYGTPTYEWDGLTSVTATAVCEHDDSHVVTQEGTITSEVTTPAECEKTGIRTYTATFENDLFAAQIKEETIPATGHDYELTGWTWAEDFSTATVKFTCKNDAAHVETVDAAVTSVTTEPTCEEAGKTVYTAKATFEDNEYTDSKEQAISALGHKYGEPTYEWDGFAKVTATAVCEHDASHIETETVSTTSKVTTPAECEKAGIRTYTATFENDLFSAQTKEETIPATGHSWGEPAYVWADDNSSVTATRICANNPEHVDEEIAVTTYEVTEQPTVETAGKGLYTAAFQNTAFETQTKEVVIPAIEIEEVPAVIEGGDVNPDIAEAINNSEEPIIPDLETLALNAQIPEEIDTEEGEKIVVQTYIDIELISYSEEEKSLTIDVTPMYRIIAVKGTEERTITEDQKLNITTTVEVSIPVGNVFGTEDRTVYIVHMTDSGNYRYTGTLSNGVVTFTNPDGFSKFIISVELEGIEKTEAKAATCETAGNTEYWTDTLTGKYYSDEECTKEIAEGSWIIPATGHDYALTGWTWADDFSTAKATFTCKNDPEHVETVNAAITAVATEPTCEATGKIVYTAKATFEDKEYADSQTVTIPAIGHDYVLTGWTWADDFSTAKATFTCKNDPEHVETVDAAITSVTTDPTCEEVGKTVYTGKATFEGKEYTDTKEQTIPALGHKYGTPTYEWDGLTKVTATAVCEHNASHIETETVSTTSAVTTPATCETDGVRTYTAVFENELFAVQTKTEVIPATGHDYELTGWTWAEDFSTAKATFTCKNDPEHVETVNAAITSVTTDPTCEEAGKTVYTTKASFEGKEYTDVKEQTIPAIGHKYGTPTYEWDGLTKVTATAVCEHDASHIETETVSTTSAVTKEATCETDGVRTYTAAFENELFSAQTKTEVIPATGHAYELTGWTWAEDFSTATVKFTCKNDSAHVQTVKAAVTAKTTAATCEAAGKTVYTAKATFEGKEYTDTKEQTIPALGHKYGTPTYTWSSDNSSVTAKAVCANDSSHTVTETAKTTYKVTKQATVEAEGTGVYTAEFKNTLFTKQTKTVSIPRLTPTPTPTPTATPTPTTTPTPTPTPTPTAKPTPTPTATPEVKIITMYRLYNPNSGEHFYTAKEGERDFLVTSGWQYEGIGWYAPETSNTPVYRLYNEGAGDHHYTMNVGERDYLISIGWTDEGTGWFSDDAKTVPLYREYNPNMDKCNHNYTTNLKEHEALTTIYGWKDEGIGWYGVNKQ